MKSHNLAGFSLLFLITLMVVNQPAYSAIHTGRNVLGLATEANENGVFEIADQPTGNLQLHLMVYGYEHTIGIKAWDCAVVLPEGITLESTELMGNGSNFWTQPGYFRVTVDEPLMPVNGMIHLATLNLITTDHFPKDFYLEPAPLWGNTGGMEYARATDESLRFDFTWPELCSDCPVFRLTNNAQAAEDPSLDWIKSLFR